MAAERRAAVLVVDDEPNMAWLFEQSFGREFAIRGARSWAEAKAALSGESAATRAAAGGRGAFDLVMLDLRLPDTDGLAALDEIRRLDADLPVVMMTAYATVKTAVAAMKAGARDYIIKPFDVEEVRAIMRNALQFGALSREVKELERRLREKFGRERILGISPQIAAVRAAIEKVAASDVAVLVLGESGTGKELVAQAIHYESARRRGPLVPINCAALPENLLESELFGYEKGAFTGAVARKVGKFELADGGTLFLDEIGDMPQALQGKLLRVLEEQVIERLGGTKRVPVDVRIVAATNKNVAAAVTGGLFREDLYYRLAVVPITIAPLRERPEDVAVLARHFLREVAARYGAAFGGFAPDAMAALLAYRWPGNVRELKNVIERTVVLGGSVGSGRPGGPDAAEISGQLLPEHIRAAAMPAAVPAAMPAAGPTAVAETPAIETQATAGAGTGVGAGRGAGRALSLKEATSLVRDREERELIEEALRRHGGNRTRAASELGISRRALQLKLKRLNLS